MDFTRNELFWWKDKGENENHDELVKAKEGRKNENFEFFFLNELFSQKYFSRFLF